MSTQFPALGGFDLLESFGKKGACESSSWQPCSLFANVRRAQRIPFCETMCLMALDGQFAPAGPACLVRGRDISAEGLSFEHQQAISQRFVALGLETPSGQRTIIVRLTWCRFLRSGGYLSGGRILHLDVDVEMPDEWHLLAHG